MYASGSFRSTGSATIISLDGPFLAAPLLRGFRLRAFRTSCKSSPWGEPQVFGARGGAAPLPRLIAELVRRDVPEAFSTLGEEAQADYDDASSGPVAPQP
jgi:hypothetical protein